MDSRPKTKNERRATSDERRFHGSAIILAIVLTTLLAIVAVMFLLSSRLDWVGTSAIADNKNLNLAVDTVIAQISDKLTLDIPGGLEGWDYYDYPDFNNAWLASLEPNNSRLWPHITDLYYPPGLGALAYDLPVTNFSAVIPEYQQFINSNDYADADGDGVADSRWVLVQDVNSSKGKPVFAAIRIIDNSAMLNVNTGFKFDPVTSDGNSQTHINVMALAGRPAYTQPEESDLKNMRAHYPYSYPLIDPNNLDAYQRDVIWRYGRPDGNYTPFDISDELQMRNRFLLKRRINNQNIVTRLEKWGGDLNDGFVNYVPFDDSSNLPQWFVSAYDNGLLNPQYAYRHIATTYNYDRIIDPIGQKMYNINDANSADKDAVYQAVRRALNPNISNSAAAQITANLIDYIDGNDYPTLDLKYDPDNKVTVVYDNGIPHFGFEQPCIYISEIAQNFFQPDPNNLNLIERAFAVELFKPYMDDPLPGQNNWRLIVGLNAPIDVNWSGSSRFHVFIDDAYGRIRFDFNDINDFNDANAVPQPNNALDFNAGSIIDLQRRVYDPCAGGDIYVTVDRVVVPATDANSGWLVPIPDNPNEPNLRFATHSIHRDISPHKCIRRLWEEPAAGFLLQPTLGGDNFFVYPDANFIQAHPANKPFTNVGEFGQLFYNSTYRYEYGSIVFSDLPNPGVIEPQLRIDLNEPAYQQAFNYLTVFDPTIDGIDNDGDGNGVSGPDDKELKIKGRININTAPWFVLAQLPWISEKGSGLNYRLAQNIVAFRDKIISPTNVEYNYRIGPYGFQNIGQLNLVIDPNIPLASIDYYWRDVNDLSDLPDLTPADGAPNDFEERDAIFARISNLVTVRSDVFTAYILVRIGQDGPQKRVVAILDRSEAPAKPVKVIAIQQVPDPR